MEAIVKILLRLAILALGITVAAYLIPGIDVASPWDAFKAAIILGILNISIKPVLILLTLPITFLTLGLFTIVINGLILWMVAGVVAGVDITGFLPSVAGAVVVSLLSMFLGSAIWD